MVDLFAGGGGASLGMQQATGRNIALAIDHDPLAIAMHEANHPDTLHLMSDIFRVDPQISEWVGDDQIEALWASPDCRHFSRAKGGVPVSGKIRGMAWVVIRWAKSQQPRVIFLENVEEFQDWGPLDDEGYPIKTKKGLTFRVWLGRLRGLGYEVDYRILNAADFGAPTKRKRLFLIARNDGKPIRWPDPSHGVKPLKPYRTASECIDWSIPCRSVFGRKKPLAENTLRRIAHGVMRYAVNDPKPFLVNLTHSRSLKGLDEGEGSSQLVAAFLSKHYTGMVGHRLDKVLGTITQVDHHALSVAHLTKFYGTSKAGHLNAPMSTITAGGQHIGLVAGFLQKYYTSGGQHQRADVPLHTLTCKGRFSLVVVKIEGGDYVLTDIGMRMLEPHELAAAQGFPPDYKLIGTKSQQIAKIGNSVCPPVVAAVVRANLVG